MRIGVDIDGVIADSYTVWLGELNQYFGKKISVLEDYDIHRVYDVSWDEMNHFFKENVQRLFMLPQPMKGAVESLEALLAEGHEIIFVTARTPEEKNVTLRWMDQNRIPYRQFVFIGDDSKVEVAKEWHLELFIEDYLKNAEAIAQAGIPVLLLNADYNQGKLAPGIIRCTDWVEIAKKIRSFQKKSH